MRRSLPLIIILIGLAAFAVDFLPNLKIPTFADASSGAATSRKLDTKLGLDLAGGISVEYQAQPVGDKTPASGDMEVIRTII
jgi:preprotein translocase subunit SecD